MEDLKDQLDRLYGLARTARNNNDRIGAETYYEAILHRDPNSWEATYYLAYYKLDNSSNDNLESYAEEYGLGFSKYLDLAKASASDQAELIRIAEEIQEGTVALANKIVARAAKDYPVLASTDEYNSRTFSGITMLIILATALDLYFPDGSLAAKSTESRKIAVQHYTNLVKRLGVGTQVILNGDTERGPIGEAIKKIKEYDPSYTRPLLIEETSNSSSNSSSSSSGCYVATAVYGSYDCPEVWTLRRYRDYSLSKTHFGRVLVRVYYAISPTLVKWWGNSNLFKKIGRHYLDKFVHRLWRQGVEYTQYEDIKW